MRVAPSNSPSVRYPKHSADGSITFSYDASLIWETAERLGWPWAPAKYVPFASFFVYIGFLWDLVAKTVSLPAAKKEKYLRKLEEWVLGLKRSKADAESLIGTLNHVTLVVPEGRSYMISLCKFRATFKNDQRPFARHTVSHTLHEDLTWWRNKLSQDYVGMDIIRPPEPLTTSIYVDASTSWGIGLILDGKWLAWEFKNGWRTDGREIGWGEMVAIELAVHTLVAGKVANAHVVIRSDNQGVIGALGAGRSKGSQQNLILRKIVWLMQEHGIWVSTRYVNTKENPADDPSRGVLLNRKDLVPHPPAIPHHLKAFVHNSVSYHDPRLDT